VACSFVLCDCIIFSQYASSRLNLDYYGQQKTCSEPWRWRWVPLAAATLPPKQAYYLAMHYSIHKDFTKLHDESFFRGTQCQFWMRTLMASCQLQNAIHFSIMNSPGQLLLWDKDNSFFL
jgi:hypothetical protein